MDKILKEFLGRNKITYNVFDLNETSIEEILDKVTFDVYECAFPLSHKIEYSKEVNAKIKWGLDKYKKDVEELKAHFSLKFFIMYYLHYYLHLRTEVKLLDNIIYIFTLDLREFYYDD